MRPIIGITTYQSKNLSGLPITALQTKYISAILAAGGLPALLPSQLSGDEWVDVFPALRGILFTGGGDIAPEHFSGADHPLIGDVDNQRDSFELPLLRFAAEREKPFLGICRGCQVVNVALGGTLYTHIPDQVTTDIRHDCYPELPRDHIAHTVRVEEASQIGKILGEPILQVNSLHHQAIKDLAPALKAVAYAPDGMIEAVELPDHPFGLAVQWHPEWLPEQKEMRNLFTAFVAACR